MGRKSPLWAFGQPDGTLADGIRALCDRNPPAGAARRCALKPGWLQEFGTIEAGSKEVTTPSGDEWRSLARSNSVRRSKALERIIGKRVKTFSRTVGKSHAINATFCNMMGIGRGSAMV